MSFKTKSEDDYFDKAFWEDVDAYADDDEAEEFYDTPIFSAFDEEDFDRRRSAYLYHMELAKVYQKKGYRTILDIIK